MLRPAPLAISLLGLLVGVSTAVAQGQPAAPAPVGLSLGLRAGYGFPAGRLGSLGEAGDTVPMSEVVKGMVPLWLDVGFRITPHLSVGAFVQYGFGLVSDEQGECDDCSLSDLAFGAGAYLHVAPGARFDPWVGLGLGYEILSFTDPKPQRPTTTIALKGFQFLVVQLGADVATGSAISVGPFVAVSVGRYDTATFSTSQGGETRTVSSDLAQTGWHQWITLGVQGKFNL